MQRVLIGTAAILLAAGTTLIVGVEADPNPPSADPVPAYLKPVPMDAAFSPDAEPITIDVPINGTIYPPDLIPPQFAWRDNNPAATIWRIEVIFGEKARSIQIWSAGEKMRIGPVDETLVGYFRPHSLQNKPPITPGAPTPKHGKRSRNIPSASLPKSLSPDLRASRPASPFRAPKPPSPLPKTQWAHPSSIAMSR